MNRTLILAALAAALLTACEGRSPEKMRQLEAIRSKEAPGATTAKAEPLELPVICKVPPFRLWNEEDDEVSLSDYQGKVWVADYIFTNCIDPCPILTAGMKRLQDEFKGEADFKLLTISVDPGRDSPEVLHAYARQYQAISGKWTFAVDTHQEIRELQDGMKIDGDPNKLINHSVRFVLIDRNGDVRGYYNGKDPDKLKELKEHIRSLLAEKRP